MLIKRTRTPGAPRIRSPPLCRSQAAAVSTAAPSCAAPVLPPAVSPRSARCRSAACARPRPDRRPAHGAAVTIRKNICTHCSVGCTVTAEVANGVWIGQEPSWDSPINRGSHCAKGAAVRETVHERAPPALSDEAGRRPMDPHLLGSGDQRDRRQAAARSARSRARIPSTGSARPSSPTKAPISIRKLGAFWGTNNTDHQARICHSTTVAGVANTWGYGAMTNSYNDIRNAKTMIIMGGNPAEAHPVSLQHMLEGKELNRANMIVIDPRLTRTAAHATEYVRMRPGTDIPVLYGMLWHIFQNGWEDKEFIQPARLRHGRRPQGSREVDAREVERVTGVPGEQLKRVAEMFATGEAGDADLVHGPDPAHGRHRQRARELHPAARDRQCRRARHRRQHLPRPRQRAGRDRRRPRYRRRCRSTTASPKAPGSIGAASGRSTTTGCSRASTTRRSWKRPAFRSRAGSTRRCCRRIRSRRRTTCRRCSCMGHGGNTHHAHAGSR